MPYWQMDDAFIGHHKTKRALRAGAEALQMWCALRTYVAVNLTDGLIPDEDIDDLPHAPKNPRKWLKVLVECGKPLEGGTRGPGLIDPTEGGWFIHNYAKRGMTKEAVEHKREQSRVRQQRFREGPKRVSNGVTPSVTNGVSNASPSHPIPSQDLTYNVRPKDLTAQRAPEPPASPSVGDSDGRFPENAAKTAVPLNLTAVLRKAGVVAELAEKHSASAEDVEAVLEEFVAYWSIGEGSGKHRRGWAYQARLRVDEQARSGRLIGRATPPGAAEHAARGRSEPGLPAGWTRHPGIDGAYLDDRGATRMSLPGRRSGVVRNIESPVNGGELMQVNVAQLAGKIGRAL